MQKLSVNAVLTTLIIPVIIFSCRSRSGDNPIVQTVPVRIEQVKSEEVQLSIRSSGRLSPASEQKLSFRTGGIVEKIYVTEGQLVKEGQLLAELKKNEIQALTNQAKEAYEKAKRDFDRIKNLYADTVATLEQYQNAQTALIVADSQLEIARFNLRHSTIKAPTNGKILRKLSENNELVAPGYPVFLFGSEKGLWQLKVNVTDREIVLISTGDSAHVTFDAHPGILFRAVVSEKSALADPYTGLFEVTLGLSPSGSEFVAGFIGKAVIFSKKKEIFISVSIEALLEAHGNEGILHVLQNKQAVRRNISILRIEGGRVLVEEGLEQNEWVITEGTSFVKPKSQIQVMK